MIGRLFSFVVGGHPLAKLGLFVVASFAAGALLTLFNINPVELWRAVLSHVAHGGGAFFAFATEVFDQSKMIGLNALERGLRYVATGAILIGPAWLIYRILGGLLFSARRIGRHG
ncbi:MAG: hypothetical protein AAFR11_13305 [Pseudomonadota bacterium]